MIDNTVFNLKSHISAFVLTEKFLQLSRYVVVFGYFPSVFVKHVKSLPRRGLNDLYQFMKTDN